MGKRQNNKKALQVFEFPLHRFKSSTIKYYTKITAYELVYTDERIILETTGLRFFNDAIDSIFKKTDNNKNTKAEESSKQETETKPNENPNSDSNKDKSGNHGLCNQAMDIIEDIGEKALNFISENFLKRDKEIRWVAYLPLPSEFPAMDFVINWTEESLGFVGQIYNSTIGAEQNKKPPLNAYINTLLTKVASPILSDVAGKIASVIPGSDILAPVGDFIKEEFDNLKKLNLHNIGVQPVIDDSVLILDDVERRDIVVRWELVARSPEEMIQIKGIRDALVLSSLPAKSINGLEYPFLFEITLHTSSIDGEETNWFFADELIIRNITINPTNEAFSWNYDGNPTKIELEIHLGEVNKMYRDNLKAQIGINSNPNN